MQQILWVPLLLVTAVFSGICHLDKALSIANLPRIDNDTSASATATIKVNACSASRGIGERESCTASSRQTNIASRADVRCRFASVKFPQGGRRFKLFKIFMSPKGHEHEDWCELLPQLVVQSCGEDGGVTKNKKPIRKEDVQMTRCDTDGRDYLWQHGNIAVFKFFRWNATTPQCVQRAIEQSLQGSVVDWMQDFGCYNVRGDYTILDP